MTIYLDTNYLIRFFTKDIPEQAQKAKETLSKTKKIYIATIVLAETVFILENHYQARKLDICESLFAFIKQPNISSPQFTPLALTIYKGENISFYDCLLIAETLENKAKLESFDIKLMKIFKKYEKYQEVK